MKFQKTFIYLRKIYKMKINLVNDGIFPIIYNHKGEKIHDKLDTGFEFSSTIQGEGILIGVPSLFIRLSGCNLRCAFFNKEHNTSNLCDTPYSSHYAEKNIVEIDDIIETVKHNTGYYGYRTVEHIVISGGEPTIQKEELEELLFQLRKLDYHTTIETNATIFTEKIAENTSLISMSPKLNNSNPTLEAILQSNDSNVRFNEKWLVKHNKLRKNLSVIQKYIDSCYENDNVLEDTGINYGSIVTKKANYNKRRLDKSFQLKFVVSDINDIKEIKEEFVDQLLGVKNSDVVLMPEGITDNELKEKEQLLVQQCIKYGWRYSPRLHINLFGKSRSV